jgi:hypothetical protein
MPIEPGDSWFSPKCIEVQPRGRVLWEVERWLGSGPSAGYQPQPNCECPESHATCVRRRGLSFVVERETAQTTS